MPLTLATTFTDVLNSFRTLGFAVGFATAVLAVIVLHIIWLIRRHKRNREFVAIPDNNGGNFMLSYNAIRSQLFHKLQQAFPELKISKINFKRGSNGMNMTIKAHTSELANIKVLSSSVHAAIQRILVQEDGFIDVFDAINIEIIDFNAKLPKGQETTPPMEVYNEPPAQPEQPMPPMPPMPPEQPEKPMVIPQITILPEAPAGEAPARE